MPFGEKEACKKRPFLLQEEILDAELLQALLACESRRCDTFHCEDRRQYLERAGLFLELILHGVVQETEREDKLEELCFTTGKTSGGLIDFLFAHF